jgi:hypothetical protein
MHFSRLPGWYDDALLYVKGVCLSGIDSSTQKRVSVGNSS